jgi:hypothetical protein
MRKLKLSLFIIMMIIILLMSIYTSKLPFSFTKPLFLKSSKLSDLYIKNKANFTVNNTYALVFYGRKAQSSILLRYLERNLKINGGVLDKIVFAVKTNKKTDLEYLDSIMKQNKSYYQKVVFGSNHKFREIYENMQDNDLIFKIDDDIVFISDGTFENMLQEYLTNNLLFLSANVINHPLLSHVHARLMAILPFYEKSNFTWARMKNGTDLDTSECKFGNYDPFSQWWHNAKCAAIVHESFHEHIENNELNVYDFNKWDFHQMGYNRWSINFVLMRGKYANKMKIMFPSIDDDEVVLSKELPNRYGQHCFSLGSAIVVHFSYFKQFEYLIQTNLLKRYDDLSNNIYRL